MAMTKFRAPALPLPGQQYSQEQINQLIRALTLYFNQLDSTTPLQADSFTGLDFFGGLFTGAGRGLQFPHISVQDLSDQILTAALTPKRVFFTSEVSAKDMFYVGGDGIYANYAGVYNFTYSAQLVNTANAQHYAWIWMRKNGVDLPFSTTKFSVQARKSASEHTYVCAVSNIVVYMNPGDYIELWWTADAIYVPATSSGIYMEFYAENSDGFNHPSLPSIIFTGVFLSALPGSDVIGVVGKGLVGSVTVNADASTSVTGVTGTGGVGSVTVSV